MALVRLQLSLEQTAMVEPLIRRARQQVGPTGGSRSFAPSIVFGEVDMPWFDASNPDKDMMRAEFRCGVVSAKSARKIRKVLAEDAPPAPVVVPEQEARPRVVAVDFETVYDTEYSVTKLGYHAYVHDARFNAYLVSFWADDGWHWVGHPKNAPWEKINGATWLSHNAQFDRAVFFRLQVTGVIPVSIAPGEWHCTSALSVYLAAPRNLAGAARELVGMHLDKRTRSKACGDDMQSLFGQSPEMLAYALKDAEACYRIWMEHSDKWPVSERRISAQTIRSGERGIQIDGGYVLASIELLKQPLAAAAALIPWAKFAPPTSPKELAKACRAVGINPPASTAEDSSEFDEWQEKYGARFPWIAAMQTYRRVNRKLKILQAALIRCRAGYEMTFSLKYFGGFTGRWSGDSGFNCLTGDHEVLTPEGWVRLDVWDETLSPIMQWDISGRLSFVRAGKVSKEHVGMMTVVDNARIRMKATPDHRVVHFNSNNQIAVRPAQSLVSSRMSRIPMSGVFNENELDRTDAELRFLVALAADGSVNQKGRVSFGFKKTRKISRLRGILAEIGCPYHETVASNGATQFYVNKSDKPEWVDKGFGDWLLELSHQQAQLVIEELRHWDGTSHQKNGALIFCTTRRDQAEWVATLAHLHGRTVSVNQYKTRWDVYFKEQGSQSHVTPSCDVEEVCYDGNVYCPQVQSGMFLVRYRDRIHVTGNCQNLNKEKDFDVDVRRMLIPRAGCVFVICDLAQIEPRCLAYLSGNWALLERIAGGESIYEAHARATMGWTGGSLKKEKPRLYGLGKARVLGLGYQCAAAKFVTVARIMGGIEITLAEAEKTVADFRRSNPLITGLWSKLEREFVSKQRETHFLKLPSGRYLRYFAVDAESMTAANERGGPRYNFYGGKLVENLIQGTARDVFAEGLLRVEDAGFPVLFHVHDEVIVEVPIAEAEVAKTEIERLMSICPSWLEGCPLGAEAVIATHYLK